VVPLIVTQSASSAADRWLQEDAGIVLWTFTAVEVTSALRRLVREGSLRGDLAEAAEARVDALSSFHVISET
jgi:predicted nucleic acid-binding protein